MGPAKLPPVGKITKPGVPEAQLLGVRIDAIRLNTLLQLVVDHARSQTRTTILYVNVHCLNLARRDATMRRALDSAQLVYCDGTGVRLAAWLTGQHLPERMTGADWIYDLARVCIRYELSLFLLGGEPGLAHEASIALRTRFPHLRIVGYDDGFKLSNDTIGQVNRAHPDILLVGLGSPTQEKWIAAHRHELDVSVVWAVGALFAFVAGTIRRGPRWMTDHGLEWMCRLAVEPRKLWKRYLLGNPQFFWSVMRYHFFHIE